MQIELRAKRLLERHGLYKRGIIGELAKALGLNRHSVRKLLNNELDGPSLKTLAGLCQWLQEKGVLDEPLPEALFGLKPEKLWGAAARGGIVNMYLGEFQEVHDGATVWRWISRRDSVVATTIVEELYTDTGGDQRPPIIHTEYVPFRSLSRSSDERESFLEKDAEDARNLFQHLKLQVGRGTSVLIGSQKSNYLVECYVADLFGCEPFTPCPGGMGAPFYLKFRDYDTSLRSCFGGPDSPPGHPADAPPGVYYIDPDGHWATCPLIRPQNDAGMVIVVRSGSISEMEVGLFGFSGRATAAMATKVVRDTGPFWPPYYKSRGREVGVYICKFDMPGQLPPGKAEDYSHWKLTVIPLAETVLGRHL